MSVLIEHPFESSAVGRWVQYVFDHEVADLVLGVMLVDLSEVLFESLVEGNELEESWYLYFGLEWGKVGLPYLAYVYVLCLLEPLGQFGVCSL